QGREMDRLRIHRPHHSHRIITLFQRRRARVRRVSGLIGSADVRGILGLLRDEGPRHTAHRLPLVGGITRSRLNCAIMNISRFAVIAAQVIAAIGGAGGLIALGTSRSANRKLRAEAEKTGADATEVISRTAAGLAKDSREQLEYLKRDQEGKRL